MTKVGNYKPWPVRQVEVPNPVVQSATPPKTLTRNCDFSVFEMISGASLQITIFLFSAVVFLASAPAISHPEERILARIGDKRISVKEFLGRSELTVRPGVFKNKNISLNNLISEKILAFEAEHN